MPRPNVRGAHGSVAGSEAASEAWSSGSDDLDLNDDRSLSSGSASRYKTEKVEPESDEHSDDEVVEEYCLVECQDKPQDSESDDAALTELDADSNVILEPQDAEEVANIARQMKCFDHDILAGDDDNSSHLDNLYDGVLHPPENYRRNIVATNEDDFQRRVYAKGTEKLIVHAEN